MNGLEFEEYVYSVFMNLGYKVEITPCSKDFGADLIILKDSIKTVVQVKRYNSPVGIRAIQEILGAKGYYNADEALAVTNNKFTSSAKELAKKNNIRLWDRGTLFQYLITEDELRVLKLKPQKKVKMKKTKEKLKRNTKRELRKEKNNINENIDIIVGTILNSLK